MTPDQITAYSIAIVAIITAVTTLVVKFGNLLAELKKNTKKTEEAAAVGLETKHMVNSRLDGMIEQQTRTDNALRAHGIPIPHNPAADTQVSGTEKP